MRNRGLDLDYRAGSWCGRSAKNSCTRLRDDGDRKQADSDARRTMWCLRNLRTKLAQNANGRRIGPAQQSTVKILLKMRALNLCNRPLDFNADWVAPPKPLFTVVLALLRLGGTGSTGCGEALANISRWHL